MLSLRCLLGTLWPVCSDFIYADSHSPLLVCWSMERHPRSGDTAFCPLNWPFLLLGLFKTVLGWLPPVHCLGGGEELLVQVDLVKFPGRQAPLWAGWYIFPGPVACCDNGQKAIWGAVGRVGLALGKACCEVRP